MIDIPDKLCAADLIWWRNSPRIRTFLTSPGLATTNSPFPLVDRTLTFALFDPNGDLRAQWQRRLRGEEWLTVDSAGLGDPAQDLEEGVLAIFRSTEAGPAADAWGKIGLSTMVDWYSQDGELVSLHNDQSLRPQLRPIEFTEIVLRETAQEKTFLVVLNGPERQDAECIHLEIKNHHDQTRQAVYLPAMAPFSLHKLHLAELFPGLVEFCDGQHATLTGRFQCRGVFTRPYVITQGKHWSGYHGGNRYQWKGVPRLLYKHWGEGEVNPMVALHRSGLTTTVNLLNSHGDLEEDFWVDARLYDQAGVLVAERKRWLLARRQGLSRGDVADLLPDSGQPFVGHLALRFSADDKPEYPGRLQALCEYRTSQSTARVMFWSDLWNCSDRRLLPRITYRGFYRVWFRPPIVSHISITNCGVSPDYDRAVAYRLRLENGEGETLVHEGRLPPHGTAFGSVDAFFPAVREFLGSQAVGLAVVESQSDLAIMHLSYHQASDVWSAEHFLSTPTYHAGKYYSKCGS